MKKLLLIILISFKSLISSAQNFIPYLDSTSTWYDIYGGTDGINTVFTHSRYYLNGDTVIAGKTYYKLFWDRIDSNYVFGTLSTVTDSDYYQAGLREDSLKNFYIFHNGQPAEALLYKFDLSVGDVLPSMESNSFCDIPPMVVSSIDSVYMGNTPLKRFHFNTVPGKTVIEGIGCTGGFIWNSSMCTFFESGACLTAYAEKGDSIYIDCGNGFTDIFQFPEQNHFSVYPNPVNSVLHITNPEKINSEFQLYDISGKLVYTSRFNTIQNSVDVSSLDVGIYLYNIITDDRTSYRGKILISR